MKTTQKIKKLAQRSNPEDIGYNDKEGELYGVDWNFELFNGDDGEFIGVVCSKAETMAELLERAAEIIAQNDKEHAVRTGSVWLADFKKFQKLGD